MQAKDWLKGWRLYYLLVITAVLIALIVLNRQLIGFFFDHVQVPFSAFLLVAGITLGIFFARADIEKEAAKQKTEATRDKSQTALTVATENKAPDETKMSAKAVSAETNIIGALFHALSSEKKISRTALIAELAKNYAGYHGLSESNLHRKLPDALKAIDLKEE